MLKPAKSPLDTYTKTHESMEPWVMLDHFGTGIDIEESFVATYTLKVRQHFSWDGEKFTLSQITPNDGLVEEYKACKRAWEGEQMRRQIVSELGKQVEVNVKWTKIGKP